MWLNHWILSHDRGSFEVSSQPPSTSKFSCPKLATLREPTEWANEAVKSRMRARFTFSAGVCGWTFGGNQSRPTR